jgi:hypothetical protein
LGQCDVFKKMTLERRLAKLQEVGLCLYCFKHSKDLECYAKNHPSYKGCEENGCGGHHHWSLHWQMTVGRLFQINMQPGCHKPGAQVFTLRQNRRAGGRAATWLSTAAAPGPHAKEMGFRKLEKRAAVMGFGETTPISAEVYEIAMMDRAGKQHLLEAVAVPRIHTGPAAKCPQDLRYRFLRIYNPTAE